MLGHYALRVQRSIWRCIAAVDPPCPHYPARFGKIRPALDELIAGSTRGATTDNSCKRKTRSHVLEREQEQLSWAARNAARLHCWSTPTRCAGAFALNNIEPDMGDILTCPAISAQRILVLEGGYATSLPCIHPTREPMHG